MSGSKRGSVSASRSSSNPSSRLADSTRSEPLSRSSEALKPSDAAAFSWRWRKAWASIGPAPSVSSPAIRSVMPAWPAGSVAVPPENEKDSATTGVLLSSTSQALMPSGVVISLMSIANAIPGTRTSQAAKAAASRRSRFIDCPRPA